MVVLACGAENIIIRVHAIVCAGSSEIGVIGSVWRCGCLTGSDVWNASEKIIVERVFERTNHGHESGCRVCEGLKEGDL